MTPVCSYTALYSPRRVPRYMCGFCMANCQCDITEALIQPGLFSTCPRSWCSQLAPGPRPMPHRYSKPYPCPSRGGARNSTMEGVGPCLALRSYMYSISAESDGSVCDALSGCTTLVPSTALHCVKSGSFPPSDAPRPTQPLLACTR